MRYDTTASLTPTSVNARSCALPCCPITPSLHRRFRLCHRSKLGHNAKAEANKNYVRMQIDVTQVCSLLMVWFELRANLDYQVKSIKYMDSLDSKYTIISQPSFRYNSLSSKEFKVLVSGKNYAVSLFVCVCVCPDVKNRFMFWQSVS